MKEIILVFMVISITAFTCGQTASPGVKSIQKDSAKTSFALLELFTSEGCSSCPAADRLLPTLQKEDSNVIVLSFHVDYWDNLGWKDSFSSASFTERQKRYGEQFHLESIYTPQLVINGQYELIGSEKQEAKSFIEKAEHQPPLTQITIINSKKEEQNLNISCRLNGDIKNTNLLAVLVQKHAERKIKAGENNGVTLTHTNVVRLLEEKPATVQMNIAMKIPDDLKDGEWELILYTQRKTDLKITGATVYK